MSPGAPAATRASISTRMDVSWSRKVGKGHAPAGFVLNRFQKFVEIFGGETCLTREKASGDSAEREARSAPYMSASLRVRGQ